MRKILNKLSINPCGFELSLRRLAYIHSTINLALLTLLVTGCGQDLSAVKTFGETAGKVKEASKEISQDIYKSCLRSLNYIPLNDPTNIFTERDKADEKCNRENKPSADSVIEANNILITYIETLGKLADNSVASPKENLNNLGESLKKLKVPLANGENFQLKEVDVDAGVKIITFISNAVTKEFRQKQIKQAVLCTNSDIQQYVNGLKTIFQNGYVDGILPVEELRIRSYYTTVINELKLQRASALDFDGLKDKITRDIQVVQDKKTSAEDYIEFLTSTATTHQNLYEIFLGKDKSRISSVELTKLCKDFSTVPPDQQGSNSKAILKPDEIRNAKQVILKYKANIEPFLGKHNR